METSLRSTLGPPRDSRCGHAGGDPRKDWPRQKVAEKKSGSAPQRDPTPADDRHSVPQEKDIAVFEPPRVLRKMVD